jgi:hypothetical protein
MLGRKLDDYVMDLRIAPHTLAQAVERETSEEEIRQAINAGSSVLAKYGRPGKCKVYDFQQTRRAGFHEHKG